MAVLWLLRNEEEICFLDKSSSEDVPSCVMVITLPPESLVTRCPVLFWNASHVFPTARSAQQTANSSVHPMRRRLSVE